MKTTKTTWYTFDELDDDTKKRAIHTFKRSGEYQYAYAWSDEKAIDVIREENYHFSNHGYDILIP